MKVSGKIGNEPMNKSLDFGGDPDRYLDTGKTCLGGLCTVRVLLVVYFKLYCESLTVLRANATRQLYSVECPQYSTRLEVLAYLYESSNTMSPALRPTSVPSGILIHSATWLQ